ncbi:MAG: flagellar biosynthetic protein FlhB [Glaciecola sp.]|jgi:flagellar biosynthetic protein FlhB|uniref:flagellar biosynthesis protein FlhB n=1 Tax=Congregibacter sp. TaxID=2744308 RepID=UPI0039E6375D
MAEEQTGQERTEQPTERRKEEARRKGQVPRSRELNTMLSLLITGVGLWVLGGGLVDKLFAITISGFSVDRAQAFDTEQLPVHFMHMAISALLALAPLFAVTVVAALAGPLMMGGWSFSLEAMAFKLEKLDPVKGLGRVFSLKGLAELAKALLKFLLLMGVAYLMIRSFEREILTLSALTPGEASGRVVSMLVTALIILSSAMVLIVMFDVPFELWNYNKQLRMTRQEVRDEMKETDGRPEVKQRIRNLQREISQRRMMQDVPTADVVITNPTHYSIALSYSDGTGAPRVVAKGRDLIALQIRTIAIEHDVPLYEAPPLARALYASTEVGDEIPGDLYLAVARVLAYLFQLRRSRPTDYVPRPAELDVPDNYQHLMDEEPSDGDD